MHQSDQDLEFSLVLDPANFGRDGETVALVPNDVEQLAIAKRLGLVSLRDFRGEARVTPWGRGGWQVKGAVSAVVEQECVVSLEPVEATVEETFLVQYLPEKALAAYGREEEVMLGDMMEEDPPELLPDAGIDVGELAVEYLSLSIDPYPRKPDVGKSPPLGDTQADIEPGKTPFSILSKLKKSL